MPFYALCPFFQYEKKQVVSCEAGVMHFPSYKHKARLMRKLCCTWDYEKCKRYQQRMKEYEVKENGIQKNQSKGIPQNGKK
jgi:hypothetical protein